ncbi:glycosyltransferase [uncultured Nocardioides sp.]|uniref:glycosyltransferase n=1 Tax=uncultured Nocardioides sp. TaxID=198441 RepID=UPI003459C36E
MTLAAPTIRCGGCVAAIERALVSRPDVDRARANLTLRRISVTPSPAAADLSGILAALDRIGHPATPIDAADLFVEAGDRTGQALLRAVAVLLERQPALRSRLVVPVVGGPSGSGLEHPESLAELAVTLGLDDVVRFVPPVAQSQLAQWYAAATLVAVPSYNESFGLVAAEAGACGTPVVAAAVGGLPTVVRHERSGLLVDTHDDTDWARALGRVLTEPGLHDRLAAGAAAQAREFSWDATAGAMLETYERARQLMRAEVTA